MIHGDIGVKTPIFFPVPVAVKPIMGRTKMLDITPAHATDVQENFFVVSSTV